MKCVRHEYERKNYRSSSCIKYYILFWQVWLKLCTTTYSRHLLQPAKITRSDQYERDLGSVLTLQTGPPTKQVISPQLQLDLNFNELEVVTGYLYVQFANSKFLVGVNPEGGQRCSAMTFVPPRRMKAWTLSWLPRPSPFIGVIPLNFTPDETKFMH